MKKKILKYIIPNLIIILAGIILMFIYLDNLNPTMDFLDNKISMSLLVALCFISIFNSIILLINNEKG